MTSVFHGKTALRFKYSDLTWENVNGKNDISVSVMLDRLNAASKICFLHNSMDADLVISVVHPDADSGVIANRLVLMELPACTALNMDMLNSPAMMMDPGMSIFVHVDPFCLTPTHPHPTVGKIRMVHWG